MFFSEITQGENRSPHIVVGGGLLTTDDSSTRAADLDVHELSCTAYCDALDMHYTSRCA